MVVGAPHDSGREFNSGKVYVWPRHGPPHVVNSPVTFSSASIPFGAEIGQQTNMEFGSSVTITKDSEMLAIGAPGYSEETAFLISAGAVYVYQYDNPTK